MPITLTHERIFAVEPGYHRVVRPDDGAAGHQAYVTDVADNGDVTFDYLDSAGQLQQLTVPSDQLRDVIVDPTPFEALRPLTEMCRAGNCQRKKAAEYGGDGYWCYAHRRVVVGLVQLHEPFVENRENHQRDMPWLDRQEVRYEPQTAELTISYGTLLAGRIPPGHSFSKAYAVLNGVVASDVNYSSASAPIAFGGGHAMSSTRDERAGQDATYHLSFDGMMLKRVLTEQRGHMVTHHAAVTVTSNGVLIPETDGITMVRAGHWPHKR